MGRTTGTTVVRDFQKALCFILILIVIGLKLVYNNACNNKLCGLMNRLGWLDTYANKNLDLLRS